MMDSPRSFDPEMFMHLPACQGSQNGLLGPADANQANVTRLARILPLLVSAKRQLLLAWRQQRRHTIDLFYQ